MRTCFDSVFGSGLTGRGSIGPLYRQSPNEIGKLGVAAWVLPEIESINIGTD